MSFASSGLEVLRLLRAQKFDLVLLDMIMPGLDGYQVLTRMKSDPALADIPVIIISSLDQENNVARCIEAGAEDYVAKPFNSDLPPCPHRGLPGTETTSGIRSGRRSRRLSAAKRFSAMNWPRRPPTCARCCRRHWKMGLVRASWRFLPSTQLGGDAFGYHWLDKRRFAIFVLDVCGHGVGAALLSVSVMNVLRNRSVPDVDFADPGAVLTALNQAFPMERQNNMFFTIWYGVVSIGQSRTDLRMRRPSAGRRPRSGGIIAGVAARAGSNHWRISGSEILRAGGKRTLAPGSRLYALQRRRL